jgi:KUP system potassium uptake protein
VTRAQTSATTATGIYKKQSAAVPDNGETRDSIYNIHSQTPRLERSISKAASIDEPDEDPGLRNPGDYKQKQARTSS